MRIAYFDCFHGAAGDMLLASLLDAGLELAALECVLAALPLTGYTIEHQRVVSHHVSGSRLRVRIDEPQPARTWDSIRTMLVTSQLPERTRTWALGAFSRLAQAEAAIHHVPDEAVYFHEIGAVDSIVDLVGVCAGLELLGIEQVYASALPVGQGWVATQHGYLPVPAPATLALLAAVHAPVLPGRSMGEVLTPSAAALLAEVARFAQPPLRIQRVGYGFGQKEYKRLNGLRVWIGTPLTVETGERTGSMHRSFIPPHDHQPHDHHDDNPTNPSQVGHAATPVGYAPEQIGNGPTFSDDCSTDGTEALVELRCNLDDTTGEVVAYVIERLLKAGALDAWAVPLVMKKGRPGTQLACLSSPTMIGELAQLILRETPTLGVRWERMERLAAQRRWVSVDTPWGQVRLKQKLLNHVILISVPEYEDCAALARAYNIPLIQILTTAMDCLRATDVDHAQTDTRE